MSVCLYVSKLKFSIFKVVIKAPKVQAKAKEGSGKTQGRLREGSGKDQRGFREGTGKV